MLSQVDACCDFCDYGFWARKPLQSHHCANCNGSRNSSSASIRVNENYMTRLGKGTERVNADDCDANVAGDPSAGTCIHYDRIPG